MNFNELNSFREYVVDGNVRKLKKFLEHLCARVNVNVDEPVGYKSGTALHYAIGQKNVNLTRVLLDYGARVDVRDSNGENCLQLAARLEQHDIVQLCLQRVGSNIYYLTYPVKRSVAPLRPAKLRKDFERAVRFHNIYDICKFLLEQGADPNVQVDSAAFGRLTPMLSVLKGDGPELYDDSTKVSLIKLLVEHGGDPNARDDNGDSTFHLSFRFGDADLINWLIDHGAKLADPHDYRRGALYMALTRGMHQVVRKLADMKVNVTEFDPPLLVRATPLHLLYCDNGTLGNVSVEDRLATARILIEQGADVNEPYLDDETVLFKAVKLGSLDEVRCLARLGANVDGGGNEIPIVYAAWMRDCDMIACLVSCGADIDVIRSKYDRSLLSFVASFNNDRKCRRLAQSLVERGERLPVIEDSSGSEGSPSLVQHSYAQICRFQSEVERMQETRIFESESPTYFDFLTKRGKSLVRLLRSPEVRKVFESKRYKELFVEYAERMEEIYSMGLREMALRDQLNEELAAIFKGILPLEVVYNITEFLSYEDIQKML